MTAETQSRAWWKEAIVYQIYPSSFLDSNGDGIGDLKGIISKLDYLHDLGIDVLWISPLCKSPQKDMGYDISDYRDIDERYGTLADYDELIKGLHDRGMKLVQDLVVNHTSDQHAWFQESRSSKDNPKRDWYIWKKPPRDDQGKVLPVNNWKAAFEGSAWTYDEKTEESYLHLYLPEQPDLNWENPEVRKAVYEMQNFWIDRGVDGFRMDVINLISKPDGFPDAPIEDPDQYLQSSFPITANGPRVHEFLHEMWKEVMSKRSVFTVGETPFTVDPEVIGKYVASASEELQMCFQFELVYVDIDKHIFSPIAFDLVKFKKVIDKWQHCLTKVDGWNSLYLENHDISRSISRFASEKDRSRSASLLCILNSTLGGTQYVYQGEELGQINVPKSWPIEEYKDIASQNHYHEEFDRRKAKTGESSPDMSDVMQDLQARSRDNARTPMQWDDSENAGFTSGKPWMRIHEDYKQWNADAQEKDQASPLHFYRRMLRLRQAHAVFTYGEFRLLDADDKKIFAYTRTLKDSQALVVLNFSDQNQTYSLPAEVGNAFKDSKLAIGNVDDSDGSLSKLGLEPWEGRVYM